MAAKRKKAFKPRITKRINNLSRAINKINPDFKNRVSAVEFNIADIRPGINDVKYIKNGVEVKVRYDQIENLGQAEQSSLLGKLSEDRFELRQERAIAQLQEKGQISSQFKRSLINDNPELLSSIAEFEDQIAGSQKEGIADIFSGIDIISGEDFLGETDSFFQGPDGTPELFDFYRPGEAGGFSDLNTFTWNAYQALKGI